MPPLSDFGERLLAWFDQHGRKDLPWQIRPTPYRVWVSEIMLQQTQVATVIPYFLRFMERFPDVASLARAPLDDVLHLWSGLGYYARARHLHAAAREICAHHASNFPQKLEDLIALPGIGRSTAGAIVALTHQGRAPILDGNVKRVLTRVFAIEGWTGASALQRELWSLAEALTPEHRVADYTQAIMDLGATVCARANPACSQCPLNSACAARQQGRVDDFPARKPRTALPTCDATLVIMCDPTGAVLLERRPPSGIWGGLWSLPECPPEQAPEAWCQTHYAFAAERSETLPRMRHSFTHYHLNIHPLRLHGCMRSDQAMEAAGRVWYKGSTATPLGMPAPVKKLVQQFGPLEESGER